MQISEIVLKKIKEIVARKPKAKFSWLDSIYEDIQYISLDDKGDVGEEITRDILKNFNCEIEFQKGVTKATKGWDIKSNNIKIEIKLATVTVGTGGFQHENLHPQRGFDAILFIDIAPNDIYLTAVKKENIIWKNLHRRENGVYKCDFSVNHLTEKSITKFKEYKTGIIKTDQDFFDIYKHLDPTFS
ncbi:MAG: hypothetical protein WCX79_01565 [Candidatus Paceibacterota bacterium]|jgi:hypothetical protein